MKLFPPADELQFLLGKEVSHVVFRPGGVHFVWLDGGEIHAMRDFDHIESAGTCHQFGKGARFDPPSLLHRLVQRRVIALDVSDNSLVLRFDDEQRLVLHAHAGCVENGLIQFGKDLQDDWVIF